MELPNDPIILLGILNTKLRDYYSNLDALCDDMHINKSEILKKMKDAGFEYSPENNRFW